MKELIALLTLIAIGSFVQAEDTLKYKCCDYKAGDMVIEKYACKKFDETYAVLEGIISGETGMSDAIKRCKSASFHSLVTSKGETFGWGFQKRLVSDVRSEADKAFNFSDFSKTFAALTCSEFGRSYQVVGENRSVRISVQDSKIRGITEERYVYKSEKQVIPETSGNSQWYFDANGNLETKMVRVGRTLTGGRDSGTLANVLTAVSPKDGLAEACCIDTACRKQYAPSSAKTGAFLGEVGKDASGSFVGDAQSEQ